MHEIIIELAISPEEYLKNYQLPGVNVITKSVDGRVVQLPANLFRPYISREGIKGRFRIFFDDVGKCRSIDRL